MSILLCFLSNLYIHYRMGEYLPINGENFSLFKIVVSNLPQKMIGFDSLSRSEFCDPVANDFCERFYGTNPGLGILARSSLLFPRLYKHILANKVFVSIYFFYKTIPFLSNPIAPAHQSDLHITLFPDIEAGKPVQLLLLDVYLHSLRPSRCNHLITDIEACSVFLNSLCSSRCNHLITDIEACSVFLNSLCSSRY